MIIVTDVNNNRVIQFDNHIKEEVLELSWEDCVEEIDRTVLIAAKERGYLTDMEKRHIIKMSERAVLEAQK